MSEQLAVRISEELASSLRELISAGRFETRADAVRAALEALIQDERRRKIGSQIAEGYRKIPQSDEEVAVATQAAVSSIHEEPW